MGSALAEAGAAMTRLRTHGALLLMVLAWSVAFVWFSPAGWIIAASLALIAVFVAPFE